MGIWYYTRWQFFGQIPEDSLAHSAIFKYEQLWGISFRQRILSYSLFGEGIGEVFYANVRYHSTKIMIFEASIIPFRGVTICKLRRVSMWIYISFSPKFTNFNNTNIRKIYINNWFLECYCWCLLDYIYLHKNFGYNYLVN